MTRPLTDEEFERFARGLPRLAGLDAYERLLERAIAELGRYRRAARRRRKAAA